MIIDQMITGHPPFHELNVMQAMLKIAQGHRPSRPSDSEQLSQTLTADLWNLMDACWMLKPESRPTMSDVLRSLGAMTGQAAEQHHPAASLFLPHPSLPPSTSPECLPELTDLLYPLSTPSNHGTDADRLRAPGVAGTLDPDSSATSSYSQAEALVTHTNGAMSHAQAEMLFPGASLTSPHLDLVHLPSLNVADILISPTAPSPSPTMSEQSTHYWYSPIGPGTFGAQTQTPWEQRAVSPADSELSVGPSDSRMSSPGLLSDASGYSVGSDSSRRSSRRRTLQRSSYFRRPSRLQKADSMSPSNLATVDGFFLDFLARLCSNREHGQYWLWNTHC
jgi:hypothetical protein